MPQSDAHMADAGLSSSLRKRQRQEGNAELFLGFLALGIIYGAEAANILPNDILQAWLILGYIGFILLVFEAGMSTNIALLSKNLLSSLLLGGTGAVLPILFLILLLHLGFGYNTKFQAFAAGSSLSSTSLVTTLALLNPELRQTRAGAIFLSEYSSAPGQATLEPVSFLERTSPVFLLPKYFTPPETAAEQLGRAHNESRASLTLVADSGIYTPNLTFIIFVQPMLQYMLSPIFFSSIGAALLIRSLGSVDGSSRVVWRGLVYATLMAIAKFLTGVWLVPPDFFSFQRIQIMFPPFSFSSGFVDGVARINLGIIQTTRDHIHSQVYIHR
ncbi:hypothetical protein D9757_000326 [Collybiopsis confluens]|uniref:Cation/H+ exchanger transmembrane domain-containing protein n=1 Tax=Collybiopsis confluens TaxID=2823264 RepID=A0A8H5I2C5_9AGAR|nr:hypothetical protein D9757_000326 [Collybiopsis confluens]